MLQRLHITRSAFSIPATCLSRIGLVWVFSLGFMTQVSADVTSSPVAATILIAVNLASTSPVSAAANLTQESASGNLASCFSSINPTSQTTTTEDPQTESASELCQNQTSLHRWQRQDDQMLVLIEPI